MRVHPTEDLGRYALGALEDRERDEIARHLDGCAECGALLASEEETVWELALAVEGVPSADLRARIVERHRRRAWAWLGAPGLATATVVLLLAIASAAALVVTQVDLARERALRDEYARALDQLASAERIVSLRPQRGAVGSGALVVPRAGDPFLVLALPRPEAGKAYEAWVIREGVPLPAGLAAARDGVVTLTLAQRPRPGDVIAVTLERAEGVDRPTTDPLLVGES